MKRLSANGYFFEGFAPVQMLVEIALITGSLILLSYLLRRSFRPNKFIQATGLLVLAVAYMKYRVYPPMPFTVLATYTTIIGIGIFVWVSATSAYWQSFCWPIFAVMDGSTPVTRVARTLVLFLLPVLVGVLGFNTFNSPAIQEQIELRTYNPAPPSSIEVHGKNFILQVEQNPFRVDEDGNYLKPPSEGWKVSCLSEFSAIRLFELCPDQR
jgi:hypothetical protein